MVMMIVMMNHGYTLIVVLIIESTSTTSTIMYIPPGLVHNNSTAIHKLMLIHTHIRISMALVISTVIYHLVSGHDHDMVRGSAVVDTNTNTMDTAMDKGVVVWNSLRMDLRCRYL